MFPYHGSVPLLLVLATAGVLAAPGAGSSTWPHDATVNLPLCTAVSTQQDPVIASDGDGGAIVTWYDWRKGTETDIYAQRVDADGNLLWAPDGVVVCDTINVQWFPQIAADGVGGALIVWEDRRVSGSGDIYAQRLSPNGTRLWIPSGVAVCTDPGGQGVPSIVSDGAGGAIVTWLDWRIGGNDIYAQRISASGTPMWTPDGVKICGAANNQHEPKLVSDGEHGAIVAWEDERNIGNRDVYVAKVDSLGVATHWGVDGYPLCTESGHQQGLTIISDGAKGAIVSWQDGRPAYGIYTQRVTYAGTYAWNYQGQAVSTAVGGAYNVESVSDGGGGVIITWQDNRNGNNDIFARRVSSAGVPQWTADGVALGTDSNQQYVPRLATDGEGGAVVVWRDHRDDGGDIYAQRISSAGQPLWTTDGRAVSSAASEQRNPVACYSRDESVIVAWDDSRNANTDIYAQKVERFGYLGDPSPVIAAVADVPNDEGGQVKLSWDASYLDTDPSRVVDHYFIFRSVPPNRAAEGLARGLRIGSPGELRPDGNRRTFFTTTNGLATYYWELLADLDALHVIDGYSYLAATEGDSTANNNDPTYFMVMALNATDTEYWSSNPDSAYSVDNLPPGAPQQFAGEYLDGSTTLHWLPNGEPDLAGYRLYRGNSSDFVPGPENLVVAQSDTGYVDTAGEPYFYKLSAVDIHGNESPYAFVQPSGTVDIGPDSRLPARFALYPGAPNPLEDRSVFRFDLPVAAAVEIVVYDPRGRVILKALSGTQMPAGRHEWTWDGRTSSGARVAAGVYLVGLRTPTFSQNVKAVVLD
jgi:hypothetical protein